MSQPAIIPGKRFNPWRYFMNSIFINRFSAVAIWFWLAGLAMGCGLGTGNLYLVFSALAAAMLGGWPAATWETEREEKEKAAQSIGNVSVGFVVKDAQWNEERQGYDIHEAEAVDHEKTLDLDRRIILSRIRR